MKVRVTDGQVIEKTGTYQRGPNAGRQYKIRKQTAWVDTGKAFPQEVTIELGPDQAPFPPGDYVVTPQCFYVARFGELRVDLKHMQPAKPVSTSARQAG